MSSSPAMNAGPDRSPSSVLLSTAARLSDAELTAQVKRLARTEREATVALIAHLAEIDRRRLYLAAGYSSLFTYCTRVLHLSEHAAYRRIEAARLARRLPIVLDRLAEGSVTLTTIGLLSVHLTPQNHLDLLDRVKHRSRREVETLLATLRPRPEVPALLRRLPTPSQTAPSHATPSQAMPPQADGGVAAMPAQAPGFGAQTGARDPLAATTLVPPVAGATPPVQPVQPAARPAVVEPLAPHRYRVQVTVDAETVRKLREVQALMRHQIPDGDLAKILDRALTLLLRELARQKFAATDRPRPSPGGTAGSRHIPAEVRRAVWARDGGRCGFVGSHGRRCQERSFLEFHHVVPHAAGGLPTIDNIQLRCRAHNGYEAEQYFGPIRPPPVR